MRLVRLRCIHSIHSYWKSKLMLATNVLRMSNSNPEIRFAGSSGRPKPCSQSESKREIIDMKTIFYPHVSKMHFHKKDFARSLILKVRVFGTRKWPIRICFVFRYNLSLLALFCRFLKFLLVIILHW